MTSNYQRALELADHIADVDETPRELVKQLHQFGLLMPDLTEPRVFSNGEKEWINPDGWIDLENGTITVFYDECPPEESHPEDMEPEPAIIYATNPTQLRWLALDMLAAANHLEQEKK